MNEMRKLMEAVQLLSEARDGLVEDDNWVRLSDIFPRVRNIPVPNRWKREDLYRGLEALGLPSEGETVTNGIIRWINDQYGVEQSNTAWGPVFHVAANNAEGIREIRKALASTGFIKR